MGSGKGQSKRARASILVNAKNEPVLNKIFELRDYPELQQHFHQYHKILGLHKLPEALDGPAEVTEKLHGANTRFMVVPDGFVVGSHRLPLNFSSSSKQFKPVLEYVENSEWFAQLRQEFPPGTVLYGEAYGQGFSSGMGYAAHPLNVRLFNVLRVDGSWLSAHAVDSIPEEQRVPLLGVLDHPTLEQLNELMSESMIEGEKEGIVIKRYDAVDEYGHPLWAKIVREDFVEDRRSRRVLTDEELTSLNLARVLAEDVVTPGRCRKTMERAAEGNELDGEMSDLRYLMPALRADLAEEVADEIAEAVAAGMDEKFFWKLTSKRLARWYNQSLISEAVDS